MAPRTGVDLHPCTSLEQRVETPEPPNTPISPPCPPSAPAPLVGGAKRRSVILARRPWRPAGRLHPVRLGYDARHERRTRTDRTRARRLAAPGGPALCRHPVPLPGRSGRGLAALEGGAGGAFREHSMSPLPAGDRAAFRARHWGLRPAPRVRGGRGAGTTGRCRRSGPRAGSLTPQQRPGHLVLPADRLDRDPVPGRVRSLLLFWMAGYSGGLFLPFRDATNRTETYGAGRYLIDSAKSADLGGDPTRGTLVCDFNFSFQPSCAFDPRWACPLAPPENRLDIPIRAGERIA